MSHDNHVVGEITSLTEMKTPLRSCAVRIDEAGKTITVVTNAKNVRISSRVIVALPGALVPSETDFEEKMEVKETTVGGTKSEGMFCDERMLGWGTQVGVAVQAPSSLEIGGAVPLSNPNRRGDNTGGMGVPPPNDEPGLFEKKLTKEEKKKLAAERKAAKKAKKSSQASE